MSQTTTSEAEAEVHRIILEVCTKISRKNVYGYQTAEDIVQDGYGYAITVLSQDDKYDFKRPLANFLFGHVQKRLTNAKRKPFFRNEVPCQCCDRFDPPPEPCAKWKRWHQNNVEKQKILSPSSLNSDSSFTSNEPPPEANLDFTELDSFILDRLSGDLHDEYQLFKLGDLTRKRTRVMQGVLRDILRGTIYDVD